MPTNLLVIRAIRLTGLYSICGIKYIISLEIWMCLNLGELWRVLIAKLAISLQKAGGQGIWGESVGETGRQVRKPLGDMVWPSRGELLIS